MESKAAGILSQAVCQILSLELLGSLRDCIPGRGQQCHLSDDGQTSFFGGSEPGGPVFSVAASCTPPFAAGSPLVLSSA